MPPLLIAPPLNLPQPFLVEVRTSCPRHPSYKKKTIHDHLYQSPSHNNQNLQNVVQNIITRSKNSQNPQILVKVGRVLREGLRAVGLF